MTGRTLLHYNIIEKLGEGGMGVVYKARDTHLDRFVAIKILPPEKVADSERKRRFTQEARAASALNHPNIVTVYDIDAAEGVDFIAMEYVPGETLGQLISNKGLRLKDALEYAVQIADALAAAHAAGIVHRDIKPSNIMVSGKGRAKILDFGLAKLTETTAPAESDATRTLKLVTEEGTIIGTVAYMSPEQLEGGEIDARSDIFGFGAVLHEMLTGHRAFQGKSRASLIAAVMHGQPPPVSSLGPVSPPLLDWVVHKSLEKDRDKRWQSAADLRDELQWIAQTSAVLAGSGPGKTGSRRLLVTLVVALIVALVAIAGLLRNRFVEPRAILRKLTLALPEGAENPAISPNGERVVFVRNGKLWVQDLDQEDSKELPGTDGAAGSPFWSPDSRMVGFRASGNLRTASVDGGPVIKVCKLPGSWLGDFGGTWSPDGQIIVFSSGVPAILYRVPASGGQPQMLEYPRPPGTGGYAPLFVPADHGERTILFAVYDINSAGGGFRPEAAQMRSLDLLNSKSKIVGSGIPIACSKSGLVLLSDGIYAGGSGILRARRFSLVAGQFTGVAAPVAQEASSASIASDETLVYVQPGVPGRWQLLWRDRSGKRLGAIGQPQGDMWDPALSPDEKRVAVVGIDEERDIWIHDTERPIKTRLTFQQEGYLTPLWFSSGDRIVFVSPGPKVWQFVVKPVDGSRPPAVLPGAPELLWGSLSTRSADDQYFIYLLTAADGLRDIWYLERQADKTYKPAQFMQTPFDERGGELSSDKRYIVYASDESGRFEVYVRRFPSGAGKWQLSRKGGLQPRWSKDGREIFYVEGRTLMAVKVKTQPAFLAGESQPLFDSEGFRGEGPLISQYDITRDGRRFVTMEQIERGSKDVVHVVQNCQVGLRKQEK